MSNCNCIEKVVAAIHEDKAKYPHAEGAMLLNRIAARLSPPPAPAAEPCMAAEKGTGWREKCSFEHSQLGCIVRWGQWRLVGSGPTKWSETTGQYYPTESAARRALEQAAEPGVEKPASLSECRTLTEATRYCMDNPEPAPASTPAFDAWAIADTIAYDPSLSLASFRKDAIAAALTAAHADGRAEGDAAGYARGKAEAEAHIEVIDGERKALAKMVSSVVEATRPVHEQLGAPAAPAAKEAGR